jgi:hypothetical protein
MEGSADSVVGWWVGGLKESQFTLAREHFFGTALDLYAAGDLRYGHPLEAGK